MFFGIYFFISGMLNRKFIKFIWKSMFQKHFKINNPKIIFKKGKTDFRKMMGGGRVLLA